MGLSDGFLGCIPSDEVKLYKRLRDIHHRPDLVVLLGLVADIEGLILLADRPIIPIIADAVAALEGKLLVLVLVSDDPHHNIVVLDEHDLDVEVKLALARDGLVVEELVRRAVELLDVVVVDPEFGVVLALVVDLEEELLAVLFEVFGLFGTA